MRTRLVTARKRAGYSQQTFSTALGISRTHYTQIETGAKNPSLAVAIKIKALLHYKGDDIFFDNSGFKTGQNRANHIK